MVILFQFWEIFSEYLNFRLFSLELVCRCFCLMRFFTFNLPKKYFWPNWIIINSKLTVLVGWFSAAPLEFSFFLEAMLSEINLPLVTNISIEWCDKHWMRPRIKSIKVTWDAVGNHHQTTWRLSVNITIDSNLRQLLLKWYDTSKWSLLTW